MEFIAGGIVIPLLEETPGILAARDKWRYSGQARPEFAQIPVAGQESVWDYPRPPVIEDCPHLLEIRLGADVIATTQRGKRVCETAGAPTYYFPPEDVVGHVVPGDGHSLCEWKGVAESLDIAGVASAGWRYVAMFPGFEALYLWIACYPAKLECHVNGERVISQPGGYYGGWVTSNLAGPIKGVPGSSDW